MVMAVEVLQVVPEMCGNRRFRGDGQWMSYLMHCSRIAKHGGSHFDALSGYVWENRGTPRRAWPGLDADDLTLHFECPAKCTWAPRAC